MKNGVGTMFVRRLGLFAVTALALSPAASVYAEDEGDFEYWAKASFVIPIDEQWDFVFAQKFSFDEDGRHLDNHQADFQFCYGGLADWLDIGIGYKQLFEKAGDDWQKERRPLFNVSVRGRFWGLAVSDRSRFEYRDEDDEDNVWRYRNKIMLCPLVTLTPRKIQPYVADEIFVSFDDEDFNQQRVIVGLYVPLRKQVRLELFYMWQIEEEARSWHDVNILGSYVRFAF
jgi:hypothetical protein